jgi:uncharacterized protein (DUF1684 family)
VRKLVIGFLVLFIGWVAAGNAEITTPGDCSADYEQCLDSWKKDRLEFLKSEVGFLNLAGLYWLKDGENKFGSDSANDLIFPAEAASFIGTFDLNDGEVRLDMNADVDAKHQDHQIQHLLMAGGSVNEPLIVRYGRYSWTVINRDGKHAVRLRDFESPALLNFSSLDYFPISAAHRVTADLHRYDEPRAIRVDTVVEGLNYNPWSPGFVEFDIEGQTYSLEAYDAGKDLFFVFGDQTSGRETYPAGRFLYAPKPGADGVVELDFNKAHSPPCAYNDFATCPIASSRNRIPVQITAGERYNRSAH